ncbi:MAG: AAA family ATPase [Pyrinomonadaceae bacterium]|nr:AAA family ATPase [Pyrinomonadaceae bacterium]
MAYEDDDDFDADRYESARGWQPKNPYEKLIAKAKQDLLDKDPGPNPLVPLTGKDIMEASGEKPAPLFGEFWYEGGISILFADTGNGKSTLGVQIGESIARGIPVPPFTHSVEPQKVFYVDLEMSLAQFQNRYGGGGPGHYVFSENFTRLDPSRYEDKPKRFHSQTDHIKWAIQELAYEQGVRVLIIDHLSMFDVINTYGAAWMRLQIRHLRRYLDASLLLITHVPKRRRRSPLSVDDMHGAKVLSNFADSMFAIGRCGRDREVRYIKHIKSRFSASRFDGDRVIAYRVRRTPGLPTVGSGQVFEQRDEYGLELPAALDPAEVPPLLFDSPEIRGGVERLGEATPDAKPNFMAFDFIGYAAENDLLSNPLKNTARDQLIARARDLHLAGVSMSKIARQLNISKATVGRYCLGTATPEKQDANDEDSKAPNRATNDRETGQYRKRNYRERDRNQESGPAVSDPPPEPEPDKLKKPPFRSQGF